MKITEVVCQIIRVKSVQARTASSQDSVIVRIRTDNGLEGVGEADSSPEVVKAIVVAGAGLTKVQVIMQYQRGFGVGPLKSK